MTSEAEDGRPSLMVVLRDGSEALIRPVTPMDRKLFVEGMDSLSMKSRRARFGVSISRLTEKELTYLTEVDQRSHVAWGATIEDAPAGVGRYIVLPGEYRAEVAVTVVDEYQRRGLGRLLFDALVAVARFDGVTELFFEVQPDNEPVLRVLRGVEVRFDPEQGVVTGRAIIDDVPVSDREADFVEVMVRFRAISPRDRGPGKAS